MSSSTSRLSFGIKTVTMNTTYQDMLRVWQEADSIPAIGHAWVWDHMLPRFQPPTLPIHEGWTVLPALAAQTHRLQLGVMVTSNATRPPAVLAKMAATVDAISNGRLVMGIGVGGTRQRAGVDNPAVAEFEAYGLPLVSPAEGIARLSETCTILRRLWTEDIVDHDGRYYRIKAARCEPKPVQRAGPPLLIGAMGDATLRVVAEHADIWNVPGPPHSSLEFIARKMKVLDAHCADVGRDPREITRSSQVVVSHEDPAETRDICRQLIDLGVTHLVVGWVPPFPHEAARRAAEEIIEPLMAEVGPR